MKSFRLEVFVTAEGQTQVNVYETTYYSGDDEPTKYVDSYRTDCAIDLDAIVLDLYKKGYDKVETTVHVEKVVVGGTPVLDPHGEEIGRVDENGDEIDEYEEVVADDLGLAVKIAALIAGHRSQLP